MNINKIFNYGIIGLMAMLFIIAIVPEVEGGAASANITNSTTSSFMTFASWMLPVGLLLAVILSVVKLFKGGGSVKG